MSYTAEIIAVGTELLMGSTVNTNAQEISRALNAIGINVHYHTVVGDNPNRLRAALYAAWERADIILTTGGLGPTYDDLTKQTVCSVFGREMVFHEEIVEEIRRFYETSLHIPMPENNRAQGYLPAECTVFDNPVGTAPGCAFEEGGVHVLMLPGPPNEMRTMLRRCALPYLRALSEETILSHDLMIFGMGESSVEELLREEMSRMENPSLATYAKPAEVRLRATAKAESAQAAEAMLAPVLEHARAVLGDVVYGQDVSSLEEVCFALLKERGWTFAAAESCTGGQIAARITALPGSSAVFRGGVVSYWSEVKADVLGVPREVLDTYGAVSPQCAKAMAEGVRRLTGAEIAVSVTAELIATRAGVARQR
jgi:nicotinamide-nucleotide amidase